MIEQIAEHNVEAFTQLALTLWPDCNFEEEYANGFAIIHSERETVFLYKNSKGEYIAFIQLSLRFEHVEGTNTKPVGYVEGILVKEAYRKSGIGKTMLDAGEQWCRENGCQEMASDAEWHNKVSQEFHKSVGY